METQIRGNTVTLEGYVNVVDRDSRVLAERQKRFVERIAPGTFARALERACDVIWKYNHDKVLGSLKSGNLELYEDAVGLRAKAFSDDPEIVDVARRGKLKGWSFGFAPLPGGEEWTQGPIEGVENRRLTDIELKEVSVLSITPAYIATSIEVRGEEWTVLELRFVEDAQQAPPDYTGYEREIDYLKIKGGNLNG